MSIGVSKGMKINSIKQEHMNGVKDALNHYVSLNRRGLIMDGETITYVIGYLAGLLQFDIITEEEHKILAEETTRKILKIK